MENHHTSGNAPRLHHLNYRVIALLATTLFIGWAIAPRWLQRLPPVGESGLVELTFNFLEVAVFLPALTVPIVSFYVFALSAPFRQFIVSERKPVRTPRLMTGFILVQLLSLAWFFAQREWPAELIVLPVILGGLIGGWRVGLCLGFLTALAFGAHLFIEDGFLAAYHQGLPDLYRNEGAAVVLRLLGEDFTWVFLHAERTVYAWSGLMAGLAAMWLGRHRFRPLVGFLVGTLIAYPSLTIPTLGHPIPGLIVPPLVGMALAIGVGMSISLLIVGNVRTTTAVRQAEAAELARMHAELLALRAQINPHFFFNALNTIRYFVRSEPVKARALLLDLSEMFQRILRAGDFVSLENELAHVEAYLNLEGARLGERLHYEREVADETLLALLVPTLILQPLVENAVIHGIASKRTGGTIRLLVRPAGEDIVIEVTDDGAGMTAAHLERILDKETPSTSIGLHNVDRRLRVAYGPAYGLGITSQPGEGTCVIVRVPREGEVQAQQRITMDKQQEGSGE